MNYACMTDAIVCAKKKVLMSKKLSKETKKRWEFIRNHEFSISVTPSKECKIVVKENK